MDEIRSLKEDIRRAERNPNKTSSARRKAYERVLQLAKSTDPASKKIATDSIKDFFVDFPELQDEAINCLYDLCEDQDVNTRLAGYTSLASLSRTDRKWVIRNTDVLVQLLQVDDDHEVAVVKQALQQHIDLDATRTFQVLCDQCVVDSSNSHPEEAERLRNLVINFLRERYRTCVARVVKSEEVWDVLFKGLLKAIPQASSAEVVTIVRDILAHTPKCSISSYRDGSTRIGNCVLDVLLNSAKASLQAELDSSSTKPKRSAIPRSFLFLALAAYITTPLSYMPPYNGSRQSSLPINPRTQKLNHPSTASADAFKLMRFYISLLGPDGLLKPKVLQNRLTKTASVRIAWYVARAWEGCEDMMNGLRKLVDCSKSDLQKARDDLVDISPTLLSIVAQNSLRSVDEGRHLRRAAHALARACVDRERSTKEAWAAPDGFEESLQAVLAIVSEGAMETEGPDIIPEEYVGEETESVSSVESARRGLKEIEKLIRSLLDAKGTEEEEAEEGNSMDVDAPPASASASQAMSPVTTSIQPKQTSSKTALDILNERRRESERERDRLKQNAPMSYTQGPPTEQRPSSSLMRPLSVRGAASVVQATVTATSPVVNINNGAPSASATSSHAQLMSRGDASSRPSKRAKSFTSQDSGDTSSNLQPPVRPGGDSISRTPSLLERLQSADALSVMGRGSASAGAIASKLLSPSLTPSRSAPERTSSIAVDTHVLSSRGHRPKPATATSSMGISIKGLADFDEKLSSGSRGYPAAPPTSSDGVSEFKIRGAAQRSDEDDGGGRLSLLDRLQDTSITGDGVNNSKKRRRS